MARLVNESGVMGDSFEATAENVKDIPFDQLIEAIHVTQVEMGVTGTTAIEASETVSGSFQSMKSAAENLVAGLGDSNADIGMLMANLSETVGIFVGNIKGVLSTIWDNLPLTDFQKWAGVIAVSAGPIIFAIGTVLSVISKVSGAIAAIPAVLGLLSGPVGIVIAGIAAVIAIGVLLIQNWEAITESSSLLMENLISVFTNIWTGIKGIFEAIAKPLMQWWVDNQKEVQATIATVWEAIKSTFEVVLGIISSIIETVFGKIKAYITQNQDAIYGVIDRVWNSIKTAIDFYMNVILPIVEVAWKAIEVVISSAMDIILGIVNTIMGILSGDWSRAWDGVKQVFDGVWDLIVSATTAFMDMLVSTVSNKMEEVKSWASNKLNEMLSIFQNFSLADAGRAIIGGFIDGMKGMWEGAKGFISGIAPWIKDNKGPISYDRKLLIGAGEAIMGGLNRGLQDSFGGVKNTVLGVAGNIQDLMQVNPTVDIGGQVARSNGQINSAISHNMNMGDRKRPMQVNLNIGGRNFNAFVEDISNEQGRMTDLQLSF